MRIAIALLLFGLTAFSSLDANGIHINTLTLLLGLGGLSVLISHFRPPKK